MQITSYIYQLQLPIKIKTQKTCGRSLGYVFGSVDGKYICFNVEMLNLGWTPDEPISKPDNFENDPNL